MNQKLMVVVRYDLFPHMLCYDVEKLESGGRVKVHQVGTYRCSAVLAIVPKEEGMRIKARLAAIEAEVRRIYESACEERKEALFKDFPAIRRTK